MPALPATRADVISPVRVTALLSGREVIQGEGLEMTGKTAVALAALMIAGLIGAPAAFAAPAPKIDWSELLDGITVDEDLEVGEEMC